MQYAQQYSQLLLEQKLLLEAVSKSDIIDLYIVISMPAPSDPAQQHIVKEVLERSRIHIQDEIEFILLRELSHFTDETELELNEWQDRYINFPKELVPTGANPKTFPMQLWEILDMTNDGTELTLREVSNQLGIRVNYQFVIDMYRTLTWSENFGGESWAKLTEAARMLNESKLTNYGKAVDRFIDFVHNTGSVINKFRGYRDGWFKYILDLKQHAINIRELIPYASRDVKNLFKTHEWRELMKRIPGKGAAVSTDTDERLLAKAITTVMTYVPKEELEWTEDVAEAQVVLNVAELLRKYGNRRFLELFNAAASKLNILGLSVQLFGWRLKQKSSTKSTPSLLSILYRRGHIDSEQYNENIKLFEDFYTFILNSSKPATI